MKSMDLNALVFIWIGSFVLTSLIMAGMVIYFGRRKQYIPNCIGAIMVPAFIVLTSISLYFCPDFGAVTLKEVIFVLASAFVLMLLGYYDKGGKLSKCFLAAAIFASFLFLPLGSFDYQFSLLCQFIAILVWLWFVYSLTAMNKVDGLVVSEGSFIGFVSFVECWFLALMVADSFVAISVVSISFAISLFSFKNWNSYPAKIKLEASSLLPIGFVLGWVLMKLASGGAWMFAVLLPSIFLLESGYALVKKVFFKQANAVPFAVKAAEGGAYHNLIVKHIMKANIVVVIFASFTPKNISSWSFFLLTLLWVVFEMNKLKNFGSPEPTIREITKGIFGELKNAFKQQKNFYSTLSGNLKTTGNIKEALEATNRGIAGTSVSAEQRDSGEYDEANTAEVKTVAEEDLHLRQKEESYLAEDVEQISTGGSDLEHKDIAVNHDSEADTGVVNNGKVSADKKSKAKVAKGKKGSKSSKDKKDGKSEKTADDTKKVKKSVKHKNEQE